MMTTHKRQMKLDEEKFYYWKKDVMESNEFISLMRKRNIQKQQTKNRYIVSLTSYCVYTNKSLEELINEARTEQRNVEEEDRHIIDLLEEYRPWLSEQKLSNLTIRTRFNDILLFYRYNRVHIPELGKFNPNEEYELEFTDLPTENDIERAIDSSTSLAAKALFYFVASSGTGKMETVNITVQDFIDATRKYHGEIDNIQNVLLKLEEIEGVVPLFKLKRFKTGNVYHTCCTPQATKAILTLLRSRKNIKNDDPLFNYKYGGISKAFHRANFKHGWPKIKNYYYFGCHRLRKRHASLLIRDKGLAHYLQGRRLDKTSRAYFFENPEKVREEYKKYIPLLTIGEAEYYGVSSEEYEELQAENEEIKQNYEALENDMYEQKEEYEQKIRDLELINTALSEKVDSIENQVQNIARGNDITKLMEYADKNELVQRHNLTSDILQIYYDEIKRNPNLYLGENLMDVIIKRAYNQKRFNETSQKLPEPKTEHYNDILDTIYQKAENIMSEYDMGLIDFQEEELNIQLSSYALEIDDKISESKNMNWEDEIDDIKIYRIVINVTKHMHLS